MRKRLSQTDMNFQKYLRNEGMSENTIINYGACLKKIQKEILRKNNLYIDFNHISTSDMHEMKKYLKELENNVIDLYNVSYSNNYKSALKKFMEFLNSSDINQVVFNSQYNRNENSVFSITKTSLINYITNNINNLFGDTGYYLSRGIAQIGNVLVFENETTVKVILGNSETVFEEHLSELESVINRVSEIKSFSGKSIEGLIIAKDFQKEVLEKCIRLKTIKLKTYETAITLKPIDYEKYKSTTNYKSSIDYDRKENNFNNVKEDIRYRHYTNIEDDISTLEPYQNLKHYLDQENYENNINVFSNYDLTDDVMDDDDLYDDWEEDYEDNILEEDNNDYEIQKDTIHVVKTKKDAILFAKVNGFALSDYVTFSTFSNNKFWANPNKDVLSHDWWILLNMGVGMIIINIPANTLSYTDVVVRSDKPWLIDLQLEVKNEKLQDKRSKIVFSRWIVQYLQY